MALSRTSSSPAGTLILVGCLAFALLLGVAPFGSAASTGSPAPRSAPGALTSPAIPGSITPANVSCAFFNGMSIALANPDPVATDAGNGTGIGPAPVLAVYNLTIPMGSGVYNSTFWWGDGNSTTTSDPAMPSQVSLVPLTHNYSIPATYQPSLNVAFTCPSGGGGGASFYIPPLVVVGPGGPFPITVTSNVTSGPVPQEVEYTASIAAAPANATARWQVALPNGTVVFDNQTAVDLSSSTVTVNVTSPGSVGGWLSVYYPNGYLYDSVFIGWVSVTPLATLGIAHTPAGPTSGPWNVTFWANATSPGGGAYTGPGTVEWTFSSASFSNSSALIESGPTAGSPVWQLFSVGNGGTSAPPWVVSVVANLLAPNGTVVATTSTGMAVGINGSGPPPPPQPLALSVFPSNGSAPLFFNATVNSTTGYAPNMTLAFVAQGYTGSQPGANNTSQAWWYNVTNWNGANTTVPGALWTPGNYVLMVTAERTVTGPNGSFTFPLAQAFARVVVFGSVLGTGAPFLSVNATPSAGPAALNVSLGLLASGGSAPYNLTVCAEGPFTRPNGTGSCAGVGGLGSWTGSPLTMPLSFGAVGNYTIIASLTDSMGQATSASTGVVVQPAPVAAPLFVQASYVPPGSVTASGATYGFVTTIQGGTAPYDVQWSFGDGTSGSATPGSTVTHTYTSTGSYTATLTVTDARGVTSSAHVGPLSITLPSAGSVATEWWSTNWALGGTLVIVVASLIALGGVVAWAARRREALNWVERLEAGGEAETPPPKQR